MRFVVWVAMIVACSRAKPDGPRIAPDLVDAAPIATVATAAPVAAPVASEKPVLQPASCKDDSGCGWDDPCNAHACVGRAASGSTDCDKSAPPPGRCVCGDAVCTLVRKVPATGAAKTGCTKNFDCAFDPPTGTCRAGTGDRWIHETGGFCACVAGTCTPDFVDPVACKTHTDCSWLEEPFRPAPASKVPRPYPPAAPCKSASKDSVCVSGFCVLRAWKC